MQACKAIVDQGPNKGNNCKNLEIGNGYCGRHVRNYEHEKLLSENKIPCNKFFRGCNNIVLKKSSCKECLDKYSKKTTKCSHTDCKFYTKDTKYCGKHARDKYFDEEKEKGIKYCDVYRGCFIIVTDFAKCEKCRIRAQKNEVALRKERNTLHNALELDKNSTKQLCVNCGKDYEKFNTRCNEVSKICLTCKAYQIKQDELRKGRIRNYKCEKFKNVESFFKHYIANAKVREYSFNLSFDTFKSLVLDKCYYCDYKNDTEVNGIDRVNNSIGYETENCVACCKTCNRMKNYLHPQFFIEICRIYSYETKLNKEFYKTWKEYYGRSCNSNYNYYKQTTQTNRKMPFNISHTDWDRLTRSPCYLCGYQDAKGIGLDRVDNTRRSYDLDNVMPCCGTCNNIKAYITLDLVKTTASKISTKWTNSEQFNTIPRGLNPMRNGGINPIKDRTTWKAEGIYYDILADEEQFYEEYLHRFTDDEYAELRRTVFESDKDYAMKYIRKFYNAKIKAE